MERIKIIDLSPMVRAALTGYLCYEQKTTVNKSSK